MNVNALNNANHSKATSIQDIESASNVSCKKSNDHHTPLMREHIKLSAEYSSINQSTMHSHNKKKVDNFQIFSALVAFLCSIAIVFTVIDYCKNPDTAAGYLGGLNTRELIFNFHPIFMTLGLISFAANAILSFKFLPFKKLTNKVIHIGLHSSAIIMIVLGLSAVIIGNDYPSHNSEGVYYSNLFSLHSFVGLAAIILYFQNYILGLMFYWFGANLFSHRLKHVYMPKHKMFGIVSLFVASVAVCTGAMELFVDNGCGYDVTSPDNNPAQNYSLLSAGCRSLNAIAILCILIVVATAAAIVEIKV